jgi:hypothetical protein
VRILGAALVAAIALSAVAPATAGDFHYASSLMCSDCHVMHYSDTHLMSGAPGADPLLAPGGPFRSLLKTNASALCLSCHDGRADAPDVRGPHANAYVRAAGQLNVAGDGPAESTGHTMGSTVTPPGGTWTNPGLTCQHCHATHGNAYYRNLVPNPGTVTGKPVTYVTGATYSGTAAIQQTAASPLAIHYDVGNVRYRQTAAGSTDMGLSEWCSGCHGDYHGVGGAATVGGSTVGDTGTARWLRHPTRDVTMAQGVRNQHVNGTRWFSALGSRVPVVSPSGTIPGTSVSSDNTVFCGSCHKAHGSTNRKGLIFDDDATPAGEDGISLMQTCQQCHYQ